MKKLILTLSLVVFSLPLFAQLDNLKVEVTEGVDNPTVKKTIESNAATLLSTFNRSVMTGKKPKLPKGTYTENTNKEIEKLWETSAISCPVSQVQEKCLTLPTGGYQIRNIAVTLMDAPTEEQAQELVINFDKTGKIDNVLIALEKNRYVDVIGSNISVKDFANRQMIIDFVENFRTAYNRKDLNYLTTVFSDDAIIITGKVIKVKTRSTDNKSFRTSEKIVYSSQNKQQYLKNLNRVFKNSKYIDVKFDDLEVLRHPVNEKLYGVTLKQDWKTNRYSDTGFVFLMIDFTDEYAPCIQVRTWQPEKYNGKVLDRNEVFTLDDFEIK